MRDTGDGAFAFGFRLGSRIPDLESRISYLEPAVR